VTEPLYLRDAYLCELDATVTEIDAAASRVALDRTIFYPTGGGQPHDTGRLGDARVVDVRKEGDVVWHVVEGNLPVAGESMHGTIDWDRRHRLMRTHSAMHVLALMV
jgi:misacylated tRNA(Ala) deacylase